MTKFSVQYQGKLRAMTDSDVIEHCASLAVEILEVAPAERPPGVPEGDDGDAYSFSGDAIRILAMALLEAASRLSERP